MLETGRYGQVYGLPPGQEHFAYIKKEGVAGTIIQGKDFLVDRAFADGEEVAAVKPAQADEDLQKI